MNKGGERGGGRGTGDGEKSVSKRRETGGGGGGYRESRASKRREREVQNQPLQWSLIQLGFLTEETIHTIDNRISQNEEGEDLEVNRLAHLCRCPRTCEAVYPVDAYVSACSLVQSFRVQAHILGWLFLHC